MKTEPIIIRDKQDAYLQIKRSCAMVALKAVLIISCAASYLIIMYITGRK